MNFAITGARGRLAPIIAGHLRGRGHAVDLYSRRGGGGILSLDDFWAGRGSDVVIHCAWSGVPYTAEEDPGQAAREDLPLLERVIRATDGPCSRIVFLSTGAVYGNTPDIPVTEEMVPEPIGAYARGKLAAENALLSEAPDRATVLRVTNLLGETPNPAKPQGILPRMIAAARGCGELAFWGDGSATKDYIHCEDFLRALDAVLGSRATGILNVGSGESHSLVEILGEVERLAGKKVAAEIRPHFSWDVSYSRISVEKLRGLGWRPEVSMAEAVRRCWEAVE